MEGSGFFYQAFVYLAAADISVPIAKRLGLGSVLGYLIAGVVTKDARDKVWSHIPAPEISM